MRTSGPASSESVCSRRRWLQQAGGTAAAVVMTHRSASSDSPEPDGRLTLGFSTYGMPGMKTERALPLLAEVGFDSVELCLNAGSDADSRNLSPARLKSLRNLLDETGLQLTSLMEHLPLTGDGAVHKQRLSRLKRAAEVAHELAPDRPPLIESVLGSGRWPAAREPFLTRLEDWLEVAQETETTMAVKPHRGGAVSRPSEAVWLIERLGNPEWLRMAFDYSHYAFRGMPLAETVRTALPYTGFVAVKDAVKENGRVRFGLPGETDAIDYVKLLQLFHRGGYRGDINCEVSSMVSRKPGYDPVAAAKTSYRNMAGLFEKAGVSRA